MPAIGLSITMSESMMCSSRASQVYVSSQIHELLPWSIKISSFVCFGAESSSWEREICILELRFNLSFPTRVPSKLDWRLQTTLSVGRFLAERVSVFDSCSDGIEWRLVTFGTALLVKSLLPNFIQLHFVGIICERLWRVKFGTWRLYILISTSSGRRIPISKSCVNGWLSEQARLVLHLWTRRGGSSISHLLSSE